MVSRSMSVISITQFSSFTSFRVHITLEYQFQSLHFLFDIEHVRILDCRSCAYKSQINFSLFILFLFTNANPIGFNRPSIHPVSIQLIFQLVIVDFPFTARTIARKNIVNFHAHHATRPTGTNLRDSKIDCYYFDENKY